jgi:hypothetical protein
VGRVAAPMSSGRVPPRPVRPRSKRPRLLSGEEPASEDDEEDMVSRGRAVPRGRAVSVTDDDDGGSGGTSGGGEGEGGEQGGFRSEIHGLQPGVAVEKDGVTTIMLPFKTVPSAVSEAIRNGELEDLLHEPVISDDLYRDGVEPFQGRVVGATREIPAGLTPRELFDRFCPLSLLDEIVRISNDHITAVNEGRSRPIQLLTRAEFGGFIGTLIRIASRPVGPRVSSSSSPRTPPSTRYPSPASRR